MLMSFFYLAKAFDKVPHQRLLEKLEKHGIGGRLLAVIGNWLQNRSQSVCIKGIGSSWINVCSGVPQGSVLGPLLFLIYMNDLEDEISSSVLKFADDTKIFRELKGNKDCSILQSDLDKLVSWSQRWQMEFNVKKCKVMHVGGQNVKWTYNMKGSSLSVDETEKDLGIWISSDMKCSDQCLYAFNKASKVTNGYD